MVHGSFVGEWVAKQLGSVFHPRESTAIGLKRKDALVAGVVYENWNGQSFVCHIAFPGRITKQFLAAAFQYPFVQCGAGKIIAPVLQSNSKALKLVEHFGFTEEGRIKNGSPEGDIVLLTLERDACKFLSW